MMSTDLTRRDFLVRASALIGAAFFVPEVTIEAIKDIPIPASVTGNQIISPSFVAQEALKILQTQLEVDEYIREGNYFGRDSIRVGDTVIIRKPIRFERAAKL